MILILGGVRFQRQSHTLEVMVLRDVSQSVGNVRDYPGQTLQSSLDPGERQQGDSGRRYGQSRHRPKSQLKLDVDAKSRAVTLARRALREDLRRRIGSGRLVAGRHPIHAAPDEARRADAERPIPSQ